MFLKIINSLKKSFCYGGPHGCVTSFKTQSILFYANCFNIFGTNQAKVFYGSTLANILKNDEEPNKIDFALKRHSDNLYWNLTRLYRIRNEIVHNFEIKNGIYIHISHMKYYLSFILNSILDFMADEPSDINNDKVTIEDYFITQEIIFGSLKSEKLEEFMKIDNLNQVFY